MNVSDKQEIGYYPTLVSNNNDGASTEVLIELKKPVENLKQERAARRKSGTPIKLVDDVRALLHSYNIKA